ncbi:alpha/beta hydrolase family protein [Sulfuriflexus sp.]|uniref:alpha/beta hydrolase family protein n=1 Tax=Sulfuriflexus sp. TaxID=2015443 RepID=UPI0028CDCDC9|nr:alpha/beta fold hydrolase [Sulfuriflexus sp.]MDT8403185.1 alpha/beta fold hydrolase [Sulfuriflexus sp.]
MLKKRLRIPGGQGKALGAELDLPENNKPRAYALFSHCFTCSRNLKSFHVICEELAKQGIGVLRFDFTGIGDSDGDFAQTNFASDVEDIIAVADYMAANYAPVKLLIGHSMGGTAILHAAGRIPSCTAAVTLAAPADPGHVARHFIGKRPEVNKTGKAEITVGGMHFQVGEKFFQDLAYPDDGSSLRTYQKPLLICQSHDDELLDFQHAENIYRHAGKPASIVSLEHADHLLKLQQDSHYLANIICAWAGRYL